MATYTGHSSDPNYNPDARLKAKGILLAIRKCGPPLPTPICTWEVNRWFFLSQKDECSEDVPLLLELCLAPSEKIFLPRFVFLLVFLISPPRQMSEVNWRDKSKLVTGCKRAHGQQTPAGMGEGMSASGRRSPAPRVKLPSWVQAGGCENNTSSLLGVLCFSLALAPLFPHLLHWRTDGWEVNLMRNVTVRYFVKKTTPTPPNISSFLCLCSSLDTFSLNCSSLAGTRPPL